MGLLGGQLRECLRKVSQMSSCFFLFYKNSGQR